MVDFQELKRNMPDDPILQSIIEVAYGILSTHNKIMASISGGADSDVMLHLIWLCGAADKTDFVFFDTGLEYQATKEHLDNLEDKYGIKIHRVRPKKPIPTAIRDYGVPFWGKFQSEMLYRLQSHGFQWEDGTFEELYPKYPNCKTALEWWCNVQTGNTTQYVIKRVKWLKEYIMANPPTMKISDKCCVYAKKKVADSFMKGKDYDLSCIGIRESEGGVRAAHKTCFTEAVEGSKTNYFRPIYFMRDAHKKAYCDFYGITHSRCYTEYGLQRTGCFGCPFGKRFEEELLSIEGKESNLLKAANAIFGQSYEYTRGFYKFRQEMEEKCKREESKSI